MSGAVEGVALSLADQAREVLATVLERHQLNSSAYYVRDSQGIKLTAVIAMEAMLEFAALTTPPARSYADGVEASAKVAEEQTRLNAQARRDRADDALAFEFQGLGDVIAVAIRLLSQGGKA